MTAGRRGPYASIWRAAQWLLASAMMAAPIRREQIGKPDIKNPLCRDAILLPIHAIIPACHFPIHPSYRRGSEGLAMDNDIIVRMEAEEADLAQKLEAVRQFLAVYRGSAPKRAERVESASHRTARSAEARLDKFGPYGQKIVDTVDTLLPREGAMPIATRALVEQLTGLGVEITGDNKVNSLSALLARSSKIKGYGRAGWTRKNAEDGERYPFKLKESANGENKASGESAEPKEATGQSPPSTPMPSNARPPWLT